MKYLITILILSGYALAQAGTPTTNGPWLVLNEASDIHSGDHGCYNPSQVSFAFHNLQITMTRSVGAFSCGGNNGTNFSTTEDYLSGSVMMKTKNWAPTAGNPIVFEAKVKGARGWPAWFMLGSGCQLTSPTSWDNFGACHWSQDTAPNGSSAEYDIMEAFEPGYTSTTENVFMNGSTNQASANLTDLTQNFHVFRMVASTTQLCWYIDGVQQRCESALVPLNTMFPIFENRVDGVAPPSNVFPQTMSVQYFQVCQSSAATSCTAADAQGGNTIFLDDFVGGNHYYVTQAGAGTADGSSLNNAWSVATFNASSVPIAGDTVHFSGTLTTAVAPSVSGAANNLITLDFTGTCAGCSAVTVPSINNGTHQFLDYIGGTISGSGTMFTCANSGAPQGITVENWTHSGNASTGVGTFIQPGFCAMTVKNNTITGMTSGFNGFQGCNNGPTLISGNTFITSASTANQTDVINFSDAINVTIEKNLLVNNAPGSSAQNHNDVIQTNDSGSSCNQHPSNWVIRYNMIKPAPSGTDQSWMEVENWGGNPALKIYANVFLPNGTASWAGGNGISVHCTNNCSGTPAFSFINNSLWVGNSPFNPLRLGEGDGAGSLTIENNAMGSNTSCAASGDCPQITYTITKADFNVMNQWANCSSTFTGTHGSCSTAIGFTNPAADDLSLQAGSALIGAGDSTVGAEFNQGICPGASWPNPTLCTRSAGVWDVGAFQTTSQAVPIVSLSLANVDCGSSQVGVLVNCTAVTLTNTGTATLNISSIAMTGTNPGDFGDQTTCGATLGAGLNCTITPSFTPTTGGVRAATINITDDAARSPQTISLTGSGGTPSASLAPSSLNLGALNVATTSTPQTVTLTNGGTAALSVTSISLTGTNPGDFFQSNNCPVGSSLGISSSCTITITFTPLGVGARSALVSVADNASGSPHTSALSGTGVQASIASQINSGVRMSGRAVLK